MRYTVKQLANLAGVTPRTLRYYDRIGLLKPSGLAGNGYRYYTEEALVRLQQILFYRELDLSLARIREIVNRPDFDVIEALEGHRQTLQARVDRLFRLIETIDRTILCMRGEVEMKASELFRGLSPEQELEYEKEASRKYGEVSVKASYQKWRSYSDEKKALILQEGAAIYDDLAAHIGEAPDSPAVQGIMARWHAHLRSFYEPSIEIMRGLGHLYVDSPEFAENFRKVHPDLPEFLQRAILAYCQGLS